MYSKTKIISFALFVFLCYYLIIAFIAGDWNIMDIHPLVRLFMVLIAIPIMGYIMYLALENIDLFKMPTHEEKVHGIKKYVGELHEELKLYAEAMELQKKVNEFKSKTK